MTLRRDIAAALIALASAGPCIGADRVAVRFSSDYTSLATGVENVEVVVARTSLGTEADRYFDLVEKIIRDTALPARWSALTPQHAPTLAVTVELRNTRFPFILPALNRANSLEPGDGEPNPQQYRAVAEIIRATLKHSALRMPIP